MARSRIKPHLALLAGAGDRRGILVERVLDIGEPPPGPATHSPGGGHVLVAVAGAGGRLEWTPPGETGRRTARLGEGDMIFNPAGVHLAPRWSRPVELILMSFPPDHFAAYGEMAPDLRIRFRDTLVTEALKSLFEPDSGDALADDLVSVVSRRLSRHHHHRRPPARPPPPGIGTALAIMERPAVVRASVASLAKDAGMSREAFTRAFARHVGTPPAAYLKLARLRRAMKSIAEQGRSIAEAAADNGFADQSHLTRAMRAAYGITPGRLRETDGAGSHSFKTPAQPYKTRGR